MTNTSETLRRGMKVLTENMGIVEAEEFIFLIKSEHFDYTEWQRDFFNDVNAEEFNSAAVEYERKNPFKKGNEIF